MEYRNMSGYLREKYGSRLGKICIDGGFTCPNRDGSVGVGGCAFCGERGAGEHIKPSVSISEQVREHLRCAPGEKKYIAYFQNFTNTYAPVSILRERYDAALIDDRIAVLAIGTRPDCINREVAELISEYKSRVDVWVELGLQTASDEAASLMNRGYKTERFLSATELLRAYDIPVVAHIMLGLPGTDEGDAFKTVELVNRAEVFGVKLHSVYVMRGTALAEMYERGEYRPLEMSEYVRLAADCIARLNPNTVVHRITGDCPRGLLVAPTWSEDKNLVISAIRESLSSRGLSQGSLYEKR